MRALGLPWIPLPVGPAPGEGPEAERGLGGVVVDVGRLLLTRRSCFPVQPLALTMCSLEIIGIKNSTGCDTKAVDNAGLAGAVK